MNARSLVSLLAVFLSGALTAADLSTLVQTAARYESGQSTEALRQLDQWVTQAATRPAMRADLEAALVQLLGTSATYEARKFACERLAVVGSENAVPALAALLSAEETAGIACLALRPNPSAQAGDALRDALAKAPGAARLQIVHTLGDRRDARAVAALTALTRDRDAVLAEAAMIALGKIANNTACRTLATLRRDPPSPVVASVAEASLYAAERLATAGKSRGARRIYEELLGGSYPDHTRRGAFEALLRLEPDDAEKRIREVLRGRDSALLPAAIAGIVALPGAAVSESFGRELTTLDSGNQVLLIEAVAARGDAGARSVIAANLSAPTPEVRIAAVGALGKLGDASSVPQLARSLGRASSAEERQAHERALASLPGGDATTRAILDQLSSATIELKPSLITVLAQRQSRLAVPQLLEESASRTPAVARAAFQALGRLATAEAIPALLERLSNLRVPEARADAENAAARALTQEQDTNRRAAELLRALSQAGTAEARMSLLRLLPNAPNAQTLAAIDRASQDPDSRVADVALRSLADWPDAAVWDRLVAFYQHAANPTHQALALRGLVRLAREENARPGPALIDRYRYLLEHARDDSDRKLILGALAGAAHPDALKLAGSQLDKPGVRAEAELAVKQISEALKARPQ